MELLGLTDRNRCEDDGRAPLRATVYDSARWEGFEFRPDDIVISTPPKCGTTWTQMICALLILPGPGAPAAAATLSPWLDMLTRARATSFADLEAQTHRRFIKTHTPLDGLPVEPSVTYICVGRDPRDVALSMDHHIDNMDVGGSSTPASEAAAIDGIDLDRRDHRRQRPDGERERFWQWVDDETPPTQVGSSLRRTVEHLQTFWDAADDLDVVLLHYDDLKADLEGQMRQLADASASTSTSTGGPAWSRRPRSSRCAAGPTRPSPAVVREPDRPRRVLQPRHERPVALNSSTTPTSPGTPCGAGARVRRPHRVGAPRADRRPRSPFDG